ncbi:putative recombination initiation defects 3 isoform X1 [Ziziphus jujuba]|uniref:Recombination initiation defects 3 isoform X1 n=1 Tax=Ziziphus jujuba TaxID=326968 RepID=A0ABM3ZVQ5_ZIZJJ|nr:putative recombination initiation defects 3 isoform X1 [Ziziphus jujuba]
MRMKINKASDLSSISVLPPHSRRSNSVSNGTHASQLRSQSSQQSSQGFSQHGIFSQLSQSSLDEALNDQRFGSQEREKPVKRVLPFAPPMSHTREENQMPITRSSTNTMRKWNSASLPDHRCQISEELQHRIGLMETSLNKFGMILDSVQSDVMQVNKGTKEVSLETEGIRQKLVVQDSSLQLMHKGQEDIRAIFEGGFKSISELVRKGTYQDKLQEIFLVLSALPEKIEATIIKSQNELCNSVIKELQAITCCLTVTNPKDQAPSIVPPKATSCIASPQGKPQPFRNSAVSPKICAQTTLNSKMGTGGWNSGKEGKATFTKMASHKMRLQKGPSSIKQERERRVVIESDEEIDGGFSCLLEETKTGHLENYWTKDIEEETERILRYARRRKRKCRDVIIIN